MRYAALGLIITGVLIITFFFILMSLSIRYQFNSVTTFNRLWMGVIIGQLFFNMGLILYIGYIVDKFKEYDAILRALEALPP